MNNINRRNIPGGNAGVSRSYGVDLYRRPPRQVPLRPGGSASNEHLSVSPHATLSLSPPPSDTSASVSPLLLYSLNSQHNRPFERSLPLQQRECNNRQERSVRHPLTSGPVSSAISNRPRAQRRSKQDKQFGLPAPSKRVTPCAPQNNENRQHKCTGCRIDRSHPHCSGLPLCRTCTNSKWQEQSPHTWEHHSEDISHILPILLNATGVHHDNNMFRDEYLALEFEHSSRVQPQIEILRVQMQTSLGKLDTDYSGDTNSSLRPPKLDLAQLDRVAKAALWDDESSHSGKADIRPNDKTFCSTIRQFAGYLFMLKHFDTFSLGSDDPDKIRFCNIVAIEIIYAIEWRLQQLYTLILHQLQEAGSPEPCGISATTLFYCIEVAAPFLRDAYELDWRLPPQSDLRGLDALKQYFVQRIEHALHVILKTGCNLSSIYDGIDAPRRESPVPNYVSHAREQTLHAVRLHCTVSICAVNGMPARAMSPPSRTYSSMQILSFITNHTTRHGDVAASAANYDYNQIDELPQTQSFDVAGYSNHGFSMYPNQYHSHSDYPPIMANPIWNAYQKSHFPSSVQAYNDQGCGTGNDFPTTLIPGYSGATSSGVSATYTNAMNDYTH